jgi:hypothetical protein
MNDLMRLPLEREMPPGRVLRRERLLTEEFVRLLDHAKAEPERPGRRRRRIAALVLVPAALFAAGAAYALSRPSASQTVEGIGCYDRANMNANVTVTDATGQDPTEVCAHLWSKGVVRLGSTSVPPLVACTGAHAHVIWVFPSADRNLCEKLGLGPIPEGYKRAAARFAAMQKDLMRRLGLDKRCIREHEAVHIARRVLDHHGYTDWKISTHNHPMRPCYYPGFDVVTRTLYLVGLPHTRSAT